MKEGDLNTKCYADIAEWMVKQQLEMKEAKIDVRKFGKYVGMLVGGGVILAHLAEITEAKKTCTVMYRTMNVKTRKLV